MKSFRISLRNVAITAAIFAVTAAFAACEPADEPNPDAPAITAFSFAGQAGEAVIDPQKRTVKAAAVCGTNLAALTPTFELSPEGTTAKVNGNLQTSGTTANNYADAVVYTLTTPDGETAEWTVTVTLPDDCPQVNNCESKIFNEAALAKMASLGKTIPNERVVVRSADEYNWGTEMEVYTIPSDEEIEQGVWWYAVRYEFFYCRDYYEQQKQLDEQRTTILDYNDEGMWYSWRNSATARTYQKAYNDYNDYWMWEIVE